LNIEELSTDNRFISNSERVVHRHELQQILQEKIKPLASGQILQAMLEQHVPAGKIKDLAEVFEDPTASQMIREEVIQETQTKRVSSIAFTWE
jgi:crotonobetainyl-CoA:carnitine CoA-transferase CaiB-like acyl-CoA transferase